MYRAKLLQPYSGWDHLIIMPFGTNSCSSGLPGGPHKITIPLDESNATSELWSKPPNDTHIGSKKVNITLPSDMELRKREEGFKLRIFANFLWMFFASSKLIPSLLEQISLRLVCDLSFAEGRASDTLFTKNAALKCSVTFIWSLCFILWLSSWWPLEYAVKGTSNTWCLQNSVKFLKYSVRASLSLSDPFPSIKYFNIS